MKWGRILIAGIETHAAVFLIITLVVTGYAFTLGFEAQGAPDQAQIGQFAESVSRSYWWILQVLLTGPATWRSVRKVETSLDLHGVLIGLVVAVIGLALGFTMSFRAIVAFALTVGAGRLGAAVVVYQRR